jgi:hypothetical protein
MNTLIDRMPINDVAQVLETTPLNVLMHVKRGLLEGSEGADGWMISGASLIVFLARNDGKRSATVCGTGCGKAGGCGSSCS